MIATEMLDALVRKGHLADTRKKDLLTSLRKLAAAFDISLDNLDLAAVEATYQDVLKSWFASLDPAPSAHTQRNTFQNVAQLYRAAHDAGFVRSLPPDMPPRWTKRDAQRRRAQTSPYRKHMVQTRFRCPHDQWPSDILQHWEAYRADRAFDVRPVTLDKYEIILSGYIGYHLTADQQPLTTWDQLFEIARMRRFLQWHSLRVDSSRKTRLTRTGADVVNLMVVLSRSEQRPGTQALVTFRNKLPAVKPMHEKTDAIHAITPQELENLGLQILAAARKPVTYDRRARARVQRAVYCQIALLLRLWWRVPIRSRSMREMDIALPGLAVQHPRLYQDEQGIWQLRYQGEQLKIGERQGRVNEFHVPFPPALVNHLEEYLKDFRPVLPNADRDPHLFLTMQGRPLTTASIWHRVAGTVYAHLGKYVYPHLLRTMWTDMYLLSSGGDVDTAAYMLNDTPAMVLKHYHELRADQQVVKAYAFNEAILGNGKVNRKGTTP